jgi:hypothetical protein
MEKYNTLHIFGYGECQVITDTENKKVPTSDCPSAQAVVDMVYALKPEGNTAGTDYQNVTIINDIFGSYSSIDGSFRVEYSELDVVLIDQLVEEIQSA